MQTSMKKLSRIGLCDILNLLAINHLNQKEFKMLIIVIIQLDDV